MASRSDRIRVRGVCACLLLLTCVVAAPARGDDAPATAAPAELGEAPILSIGALEYRPGRGLRVGSTGLVIGGFTNVKAEYVEEQGGEFALDNLNLFIIFDRFSRFRAVADLQFKDIFVADKEGAGASDFAFDVRRLFGDFTVSDALTVRLGTFLTPVGYWNLILAPPLTWTTEAPLIVEETFFQQTTTGAMLYGSAGVLDGQFGYSLFSQFLKPIEDNPDLDPPDYTAGLRLDYTTNPSWSAGASFQATDEGGEWSYLGGPYVFWQHGRGEVLSELYVQDGEALPSEQWGTYLQGVFEVYDPWFLVARYEYYAPPEPEPPLNLFTIGGVVKPFPFMAVKLEYRYADGTFEGDELQGVFASFTTFFEMRTIAPAILAAVGWAAALLAPTALASDDPPLRLIVHPSRAAAPLTVADVRAIYLKQKRFWSDGQPIVAINREAGSAARERFSVRVFGRDSRRLAAFWNQRYFEAGEFPPATLASDEAVLRYVAGNPDAVGYVTVEAVGDAVSVALILTETEGATARPDRR